MTFITKNYNIHLYKLFSSIMIWRLTYIYITEQKLITNKNFIAKWDFNIYLKMFARRLRQAMMKMNLLLKY